MYVSIGDKVKKGQLLATLTSANGSVKELKEQIKNQIKENADTNRISRCEIERMEEELKKLRSRLKKQSDKNGTGLKQQIREKEEDIKIAELSLSQQKETQALDLQFLRQDLEEAKELSRRSKLTAPASGEIISTAGGNGYMVQGGVTAINMADMEHLKIRTEYIATSKVGKASSYIALVNGKKYRVKIEEQEIDQLDIEMENYPDNTWFDFVDTGDFEVGDSAVIELYNDMAEDALVVPSNAVFRVKSEHYVYKMDGNAKVKTSVTIGTATDAYTQILTGVKEGDVVYVQD
jgi:multidrug efflux pump subunit AcrA (membrane-fusion protein)